MNNARWMPAFAGMTILFMTLMMQTIAFANTQETYSFNSSADSARFQALTQTIRCVVCQNQNIADSNAPLANDLREKVYRMVLAQQSDAEIQTYLVKRYGEFILLKPRFSSLTIILWLFPLLGLASILIFFLHLRRRRC